MSQKEVDKTEKIINKAILRLKCCLFKYLCFLMIKYATCGTIVLRSVVTKSNNLRSMDVISYHICSNLHENSDNTKWCNRISSI